MTAASKDSPATPAVARDEARIPGSLQFLRIRDVCQMLRISKPTLWRLRRSPDFPAPTQLSDRAIGWSRDDIQTWVAARRRPAQDRG
jgi:prophage regulatory protein